MSGSPSVGPLVGPDMFVKKWSLEYQKIIKSYFRNYLWDSSDLSDIYDSCDSCDSSDSSIGSDSSDSSDRSDKKLCD